MTDRYNPNGYPNDPNGHPEGVSPYNQPQPEGYDTANNYAGYEAPAGYDPAQTPYAYGAPYGTAPVGEQKPNGVAMAALIFGILSIPAMFTLFGAIILGVIAVILGIVGIRKSKNIAGPGSRKGMAVTGLVLGAFAMIATAVMIFWGVYFAKDIIGDCEQYQSDNAAYQKCIEDGFNQKINEMEGSSN